MPTWLPDDFPILKEPIVFKIVGRDRPTLCGGFVRRWVLNVAVQWRAVVVDETQGTCDLWPLALTRATKT